MGKRRKHERKNAGDKDEAGSQWEKITSTQKGTGRKLRTTKGSQGGSWRLRGWEGMIWEVRDTEGGTRR